MQTDTLNVDCEVLTEIYALALFRQRLGENDFNPFVMSLPRYDLSLFHHMRSTCELTQKWHSYLLNLECEGLVFQILPFPALVT